MELLKVNGQVNVKKLAVSVLVPVVGGSIVGALASRNSQEQYDNLKKPSFSPPPWVFPTVWTTLYTMMGVAKYRADEKAKLQEAQSKTSVPYDVQLGLNFLWSFLFFKWRLRGTALVEMAFLLAAITLTAYKFAKYDKTAGLLMVPYIGWVSFALGLNYSIVKLNAL
ncbi:TspO/MBR family protein [Planococcus sp. N028]|uniref:TspO/MBR family protein n=1 Tax=Planococcus shixiaomingii TaxID=3058393 RepID=A0ABT8N5J9_9BACL|nr:MULTISPECIES: TspO/MBR family protein [unclassified Planococcus (in: firmicutes)]MDN7243156.1 TspO/MBR family protein [Planococcus sp. N028]WKA55100.1 TspO/MBR family protein [Planococcus sp. N022]